MKYKKELDLALKLIREIEMNTRISKTCTAKQNIEYIEYKIKQFRDTK